MEFAKATLVILLIFTSLGRLFSQSPEEMLIIQEVLTNDKRNVEKYKEREIEEAVIVKESKSEEFWIDLEGTKEDLHRSLGFYHSQGIALIEMIKRDDCWVSLLRDYLSSINQTFRIPKKPLSIPDIKVEVVPNGYREKVFKQKAGWEKFYKKHPKSAGIYEFSKPIICRDKAIIYVGQSRGNLDGVGRVLFLEKIENHWRVIHKIEIWVS